MEGVSDDVWAVRLTRLEGRGSSAALIKADAELCVGDVLKAAEVPEDPVLFAPLEKPAEICVGIDEMDETLMAMNLPNVPELRQ